MTWTLEILDEGPPVKARLAFGELWTVVTFTPETMGEAIRLGIVEIKNRMLAK